MPDKPVLLTSYFLFMMVLSLFSPLVNAVPAESEKLLAEGVDAYNSGDMENALRLFETLINMDPSWPYGWLWKGTVLADLGKQKKAEDAFRTGRCLISPDTCDDLTEDDVSDSYDKTRTNSHSGLVIPPVIVNRAVDLTEDTINHQRVFSHFDSPPKDNFGYVLQPQSDSYQKSFEQEGDKHMKAGMYDKALHSYLLAEEINPENPDISRKVGDTFKELGDLNSALDAWNRSVQNESNQKISDNLRKKRSDAFSAQNMPEQAIQEFEKIKTSDFDPDIEFQKGELYSRLQDYSLAEQSFQDFLLLNPGNIDASLGLANARLCQGKIISTEEILDSLPLFSLNPDQADLLEKLKKEIKNHPSGKTDDISVIFSHPELYILIGVGVFGIFYFRDKIFR